MTDSLSELLRYFAERAPICWEGNDADKAAEVMRAAADLIDNADD